MPHSTIRAERESLLLVDDDDVLTDVLERAFQARGFDVRVAWTAEEAVPTVAPRRRTNQDDARRSTAQK